MHFEKSCVPISTEILQSEKSLTMPSDSTSKGVANIQNFLEEHAAGLSSVGHTL